MSEKIDVREMIINLRGGIPERCDFCKEKRPKHEMHPEEAGEWACIYCIERWDILEKDK